MISCQYLKKYGEDIFNRKAMEVFDPSNDRIYLISYDSVVAVYDYSTDHKALYVTNAHCLLSHTTRRHLNAFIENRRMDKSDIQYCDLSKLDR